MKYSYSSSTANFWRHLLKHDIEQPSTSRLSQSTVQPTIKEMFSKDEEIDSLEKVLARMASVDRISFNTLAKSHDIR